MAAHDNLRSEIEYDLHHHCYNCGDCGEKVGLEWGSKRGTLDTLNLEHYDLKQDSWNYCFTKSFFCPKCVVACEPDSMPGAHQTIAEYDEDVFDISVRPRERKPFKLQQLKINNVITVGDYENIPQRLRDRLDNLVDPRGQNVQYSWACDPTPYDDDIWTTHGRSIECYNYSFDEVTDCDIVEYWARCECERCGLKLCLYNYMGS